MSWLDIMQLVLIAAALCIAVSSGLAIGANAAIANQRAADFGRRIDELESELRSLESAARDLDERLRPIVRVYDLGDGENPAHASPRSRLKSRT